MAIKQNEHRISAPYYPDAPSPETYEDGIEFQDYICQKLAEYGVILQNLSSKKFQYEVGENLQGFEIKLDKRCSETGRLSIEIAEKQTGDPTRQWTPSGIYRSDNSWLYLHGNYDILFIFAKNVLIRYHRETQPEIYEYGKDPKRPTIRKFYLPFHIAKLNAARVLSFTAPSEQEIGRMVVTGMRKTALHIQPSLPLQKVKP